MNDARDLSPRSESGVTLIELMIVLVIIAVGILAISGVQTRSSNDVYSTGKRTRALAVAETQIEVARGMGYGGAVADSGLSDGINWNTSVSLISDSLRQVTVTASWTDHGRANSLQLINLLSHR